MSRRRARLLGAGVALVLFAALGWAVKAGRTRQFDEAAMRWFWPSGTWGPSQRLEDVVVHAGQPAVTAAALAIAAVAVAWRRRSWRPVGAAAVTVVVTMAVVVVLKHLFAVPDTGGSTAHLGGSFPSGHIVAMICFAGGIVLLTERRRARSWVAVGCVTGLMAACLLLTSVHWVTDVVAGALMGLALLLLLVELPLWRCRGRSSAPAAHGSDASRSARPA